MDGEHSVCVISNCFEPLVGLCKEIQRTCLIIRYGESSFSSLTVTSGFVSNLLNKWNILTYCGYMYSLQN